MMYNTPKEYFYRIHHVRPRFKSNVEAVLVYMSTIISSIGAGRIAEVNDILTEEIRRFPGNITYTNKTIQNWRTEIAALFSLYYEQDGYTYSTDLARDLSENQDLTKFFKYFIHTFQYPGGHLKPKEILQMKELRIKFHPGAFIVKLLRFLENNYGTAEACVNKAELCHCVFNDLRITTGPVDTAVQLAAEIIMRNRNANMEYNWDGDVTRYAGDVLDYMVLANLLNNYGKDFRLKTSEMRALNILEKQTYCEFYAGCVDTRCIAARESDWVKYVSSFVEKNVYSTDILAFISENEAEYKELQQRTMYIQASAFPEKSAKTKDIGDYGESLVYGHECMFLKQNNREDLIRLVKCIPNHFAVGYDIQSVDVDELKKYIEVKTTISTSSIDTNKFHLTPNEMNSAQTLRDRYFVYRIQLNKHAKDAIRLNIYQNPFRLIADGCLGLDAKTGDMFGINNYRGREETLLRWQ